MKINKKGISLIVLIITIIVMIIIAGAVILYLDDSKVVGNAKKAVNANNVSVAKEVVTVARAEWRANKNKIIEEGFVTFKEYSENKLKEVGFEIGTNGGQIEVSENGLVYSYFEPVIPDGYVVSDLSTEDEVSEGLVIYEGGESVVGDEDAKTTRNQYVWVPVPNMSEFVRRDWISDGEKIETTTSYDLKNTTKASEYTKMKESVAKYGGFYIARYEAGIEDNRTLVTKKEANVWNNAAFATVENMSRMSIGENAIRHLIYGEEWDAALNFISKVDDDYAVDSTGKGWYGGNYAKKNPTHVTGVDLDDSSNQLKNIYDMAGNVWEWTSEAITSNSLIVRGGAYTNSSTGCPAGRRNRSNVDNATETIGFRMAIFIK